jgi:translation initiation factor IF-1
MTNSQDLKGSKKSQNPQSEDYVEVEGKVVSVLPGTMFTVELANGHQVLAHISGKLRKHFIKITTGDTVKMEMSPYDLDKARIIYRLRNAEVRRDAPKRSYGPRRN